jgi:hypothetical protein
MDYIKIETNETQTKVEINGQAGNLVSMLANAILNDPQFGMLVITAIAAIAEEKSNPLNNLNMN